MKKLNEKAFVKFEKRICAKKVLVNYSVLNSSLFSIETLKKEFFLAFEKNNIISYIISYNKDSKTLTLFFKLDIKIDLLTSKRFSFSYLNFVGINTFSSASSLIFDDVIVDLIRYDYICSDDLLSKIGYLSVNSGEELVSSKDALVPSVIVKKNITIPEVSLEIKDDSFSFKSFISK
jgi:hypothetical protein